MNPRDIMTDAIHNFHPQYQQYTQYSSGRKNSPQPTVCLRISDIKYTIYSGFYLQYVSNCF